MLLLFDWKRLSPLVLIAYPLAVGYAFVLNIIRISLFFILGHLISERMDSERAGKLVLWLFHSNVGWILYLIGIGIFLGATLKYCPTRVRLAPERTASI